MTFVDHLWADRAAPETSEERRRRQAQYYEELRQQIAEREGRHRSDPLAAARRADPAPQTDPAPAPTRSNAAEPPRYALSLPPGGKQFAESLRTQISDRRKAPASTLSSVPPFSPWLSQPATLTFSTGPTFDPPSFEVPAAAPPRARPVADHNKLRPISMAGTTSVRYVVEGTEIRAPSIKQESPLDQSRVATPAAGFSVRRNYGRTGARPRPLGFD
jgi:hypothetical protein